MDKPNFAFSQNDRNRPLQRKKNTITKGIHVNNSEIPTYNDFLPEDKLAYKAVIFGRFLDNEFEGKKLHGIEKVFVEEFENISEDKRQEEWFKLLAKVRNQPITPDKI